jgi:hypothetical protein
MYETSKKWKQNIYENPVCAMNIYIDDVLINPDYILDFKKGGNVFEEEFCLGGTPSQYIEMKLYKDKIPLMPSKIKVEYGILISHSLTVTEVNAMLVGTLNGIPVKSLSSNNSSFEMIPIGIYNVDDYTDNDDNTITIKALDNMIKFEFNYNGKELIDKKNEATLLEVAQDICNKAGVELGSTSFLNSDKKVSVYDNTVTARKYISYIAESAGCFACIDREGKLCFREFGQDETEISLEMFGEYKWGEEFKISKVSYEDGVRSFKFGDDTRNNLWINQENMYIVDEDQVQKIYNKIKDLTVNTFEGKVIIDPAIDIGDKIVINGKNVIYQGEMSLEGRFIAQISSKIQIKQKEETTVKKESQKVINRLVQSRINQAEGKIEQLVEETTEYSKKITQVEQTVDGISQKVENIQDFTKEKEQIENLYIDDIAGGEGYLLDFIIFGNTELFKTKDITICASENKRGYGDSISLFLEDGNELLTEDNKQILIKHEIQYIKALKITLDDYLRNFVYEGNEYCDTLEIKQDGTIKIIKRIGVDDEGNLYLLEKENEIILKDKIVLPSQKESGTYYFIKEIQGIKYYAKYITKNDYSDAFLTELELGTKLEQNAEYIRVAWNQISQYIQMEGIEGKATLNIYDKENNILVSLNQNGENFYNSENKRIGYIGIVRGEEQDTLAFVMDVDWENGNEGKSMAWGYNDKNGKFLPIFHLVGSYGSESGEYGGKLVIEGELSTEIINVINQLNFVNYGELIWNDGKTAIAMGNSFRDVSREVLCFKTEDGLEFKDVNKTFLSMYDNTIWIASPFWVGKEGNTSDTGWTGYPMIGVNDNNSYYCQWSGNQLYFYVDGTQAGWISDKRLKKDFKEIDDDFLKAIDELKIQQFKADNRNGLISFGIIAQDLEKSFKKYNINPSNYEILQKIQYKLNEKELYYTVEYTQFLILKQLASERKIQKLQEKDIEKDKTIQDLLKRIERLEEKS